MAGGGLSLTKSCTPNDFHARFEPIPHNTTDPCSAEDTPQANALAGRAVGQRGSRRKARITTMCATRGPVSGWLVYTHYKGKMAGRKNDGNMLRLYGNETVATIIRDGPEVLAAFMDGINFPSLIVESQMYPAEPLLPTSLAKSTCHRTGRRKKSPEFALTIRRYT